MEKTQKCDSWRPGRFDCIIPVGGLDDPDRRTIFEHYLANTNLGDVDVHEIVTMLSLLIPADIEYLFRKSDKLLLKGNMQKKGIALSQRKRS